MPLAKPIAVSQRRHEGDYFDNQIIILANKTANICWSQCFKCEVLMVFFVMYDIKINIFDISIFYLLYCWWVRDAM